MVLTLQLAILPAQWNILHQLLRHGSINPCCYACAQFTLFMRTTRCMNRFPALAEPPVQLTSKLDNFHSAMLLNLQLAILPAE